MAEEKKADHVDTAPDPEEDDLDELDDEFSALKLDTKEPTPAASGPGRPPTTSGTIPSSSDPATGASPEDDFARQLQDGMADLLGELNNSPEMQKEFEKLVKELGGAAAEAADQVDPTLAAAAASGATAGIEGSTSAAPGESKKDGKPDENFQDAIRRTMERMQTSSETATNAAASSSEDDMLAQMLKEMEKGGFGGEGGDEDFSKMLMGMMEQLTNKEILYEPMKELDDKFPAWMEKNREKTPKDDLQRYDEQQTLVREIVARFEEKTYSDSNTKDREYIVERMQKMQAAGSPPADLVGDMSAAQEALGELDAGCPTQ
ncbi:Pex19 protein [Rhizodiscina lignyota]|uniref:Pex19 protein n=1 Tax=Rhizodiscina lignyota TaxID=1504668 RepID=A0A9P4M805_9PEZI|nr:Pex19 protein [Rhizodiscina lignyota]